MYVFFPLQLTIALRKEEEEHPKVGLPFRTFNPFGSKGRFTGISTLNFEEWTNQVNDILKGLSSDENVCVCVGGGGGGGKLRIRILISCFYLNYYENILSGNFQIMIDS